MLRFSGAGVTDVGLVRDHNEDSGFVGPYVALVADGVGGAAAGEVASATTAYVVSATALARFGEDPAVILEGAITTTWESLRRGVEADVLRAGMATTLTAVATDGKRVVMAHVGDSRAYLFRGGELSRISRDHTYVQQLVDEGKLDASAAPHHPWRNVVLRSLHGNPTEARDEIDVLDLESLDGDRILLCSDGLSDLVDEEQIAEALALEDPQSAAAVLTKAAIVAGGTDNVTCIVLDVLDGPEVCGDGQLLGAVRDIRNVADPAAVRTVESG